MKSSAHQHLVSHRCNGRLHGDLIRRACCAEHSFNRLAHCVCDGLARLRLEKFHPGFCQRVLLRCLRGLHLLDDFRLVAQVALADHGRIWNSDALLAHLDSLRELRVLECYLSRLLCDDRIILSASHVVEVQTGCRVKFVDRQFFLDFLTGVWVRLRDSENALRRVVFSDRVIKPVGKDVAGTRDVVQWHRKLLLARVLLALNRNP